MMYRVYLIVLVVALALGKASVYAQLYPVYGEPLRPGFHFSPANNWTNEPNGLIYFDGQYHLFYQANPFNNQFGNQSWGHATSSDLINWVQQPVAIPGSNGILSFSGSAVHDESNTSGLGSGGSGPLIAAFTGFIPLDLTQDQRLAFSNDGGMTWSKYAANPVIPRLPGVEGVESRDPKVFWHPETSKWKMLLAHGGQKKISFWESNNLLSWSRTSDFFAPDIASQVGGWEVPDFFELSVRDDSGTVVGSKWVLSITPSDGSPAGGNGVLYFVGEYDGSTFINENPVGVPLWADYGRDFDGQQSWSNIPQADGRTIWTAVMQSYGEAIPTTPWRGQMAIPRSLDLIDEGSGPRLRQQPIVELQSLRQTPVSLNDITIVAGADPLDAFGIDDDMLEIVSTFEPGTATDFGFKVRQAMGGLETRIGYLPATQQMYVDRTSSGNNTFAAGASGVHFAPLEIDDGTVTLRVFVDCSTIEVFGNDGRSVISDLIFSPQHATDVSLFSVGGNAYLQSLDIFPMDSIWTEGPEQQPGSNVVARWSMDRLPQAFGVPWLGPVSTDSKIGTGEGTQAGASNIYYEPNSAVENLWMYSVRELPTSPVVPPSSMFNEGFSGGENSFNAGLLANVDDRGLHVPADRYGNEFALTDGFSIEMFFRTDIDRSGAGLMQLILESTTNFRFGIIVNEGGPGNVRFAINDGVGNIPIVDSNSVSSRNYADGTWHYLLATYEPEQANNGQMRLVLANQDGSADVATLELGTFQGLNQNGSGDLLIGRHNRFLNSAPRNFLGLIDEVQITQGKVKNALRLGELPDDIVFEEAALNSVSVETGQGQTGGIAELENSDDNVFEFFSDLPDLPGEAQASLLFSSFLSDDKPETVRLTIESSVNSPGLIQAIRLFDHSAGEFVTIDARSASLVDDVVEVEICEDLEDFVQMFNGLLIGQLEFYSDAPIVMFPWKVQIDELTIAHE